MSIDIDRARDANELRKTLENFCERHKPRGFIRRADAKEAARRVVDQWRSLGLPITPGLADDATLQRAIVIELDRVLEERRGDWMDRAHVVRKETQ